MFLVKVAYDALKKQFRLVDEKAAQILQDGGAYFLIVDYFPQEDGIDGPCLDLQDGDIGHA